MKYYCPQHLHKPIKFLFLDFEDAFVFFLSLLLFGLVFDLGVIGLVLSIILTLANVKLKEKYPRGAIRHVFYLLGFMNFKGYPSFLVRRFEE